MFADHSVFPSIQFLPAAWFHWRDNNWISSYHSPRGILKRIQSIDAEEVFSFTLKTDPPCNNVSRSYSFCEGHSHAAASIDCVVGILPIRSVPTSCLANLHTPPQKKRGNAQTDGIWKWRKWPFRSIGWFATPFPDGQSHVNFPFFFVLFHKGKQHQTNREEEGQ